MDSGTPPTTAPPLTTAPWPVAQPWGWPWGQCKRYKIWDWPVYHTLRTLLALTALNPSCRSDVPPTQGMFPKTDGFLLKDYSVQSCLGTSPAEGRFDRLPSPTSCIHIVAVFGLIRYPRAFISNYASVTAPLCQVLKKAVPWHWTDERTQASDYSQTDCGIAIYT